MILVLIMNGFKPLSFCILTAVILVGCNKSPNLSFADLDQVLSPTETSLEDRIPQWYADQDLIRQKVIASCFDHLTEKAEKLGGSYKVEFDNDVFSKFAEYPDCSNARKGEIIKLSTGAKIYDHQIENAEKALSTPENQQRIAELAADVAKKLNQNAVDNADINNTGKQIIQELESSNTP